MQMLDQTLNRLETIARGSRGRLRVVRAAATNVSDDFLRFLEDNHPHVGVLADRGEPARFALVDVTPGKFAATVMSADRLGEAAKCRLARLDKDHRRPTDPTPEQEADRAATRERAWRREERRGENQEVARHFVKRVKEEGKVKPRAVRRPRGR